MSLYRVYRWLVSDDPQLEALVQGTSYAATSCAFGTTCWYRVAAVNRAGEGPGSTWIHEVVGALRPPLAAGLPVEDLRAPIPGSAGTSGVQPFTFP